MLSKSEKRKLYYQKNKLHILTKLKEWRKVHNTYTNKEREYGKIWRLNNKEKVKQYKLKYRLNIRKKALEVKKEMQQRASKIREDRIIEKATMRILNLLK